MVGLLKPCLDEMGWCGQIENDVTNTHGEKTPIEKWLWI